MNMQSLANLEVFANGLRQQNIVPLVDMGVIYSSQGKIPRGLEMKARVLKGVPVSAEKPTFRNPKWKTMTVNLSAIAGRSDGKTDAVSVAEDAGNPFVGIREAWATPLMMSFGPLHGSDHGLREWTPEIHREIVNYLKGQRKTEAAEKATEKPAE